MKRIGFLLMTAMFITSAVFSQTLNDAIKLTNNEQFEKAEEAFKALIQTQANNGEYYFYYGENYFKNDNTEKANEMYQKGADVNATNPFPYIGLGKVQWNNGKQTEAKANLFKANTLAAGKNATVLIKIAEVYINSETKNLTDAFTLLAQAAKLEPKNPEVYIVTGDAFLEQNNATKAIENYEKASSLDPKSVRAILRQGQVWNRAKNFNLAIDTYKKAISIDPSFAPAYREIADIYIRATRFKDAVENSKKYLELTNDCSAKSKYSGSLNQAKMYKESIEAGMEALKCTPINPYTYRYLAYSQYETADYTGGLENIDKFFTNAPADKIITQDYEYRAKLLSKLGKDSLAIIEYKKLLELQPEKTDWNSDIAGAYFKMKRYQDAIATYKIKMAAGKLGANDYFGLARAYYQLKDFINADSAITKLIELQPDYALGYLWRGKINSQLDPKNEKWQAKEYYEIYISKLKPEELTMPQNKNNLVEAYNYLAAYYAAKKDCPNVKAFMQKILEIDPANSQAKKILADLKC